MSSESKTVSISSSFLLFLVFLVLKLTHVLDWSWWWVTSPLWIPFGIVIVFVTIVSIIVIITHKKKINIV